MTSQHPAADRKADHGANGYAVEESCQKWGHGLPPESPGAIAHELTLAAEPRTPRVVKSLHLARLPECRPCEFGPLLDDRMVLEVLADIVPTPADWPQECRLWNITRSLLQLQVERSRVEAVELRHILGRHGERELIPRGEAHHAAPRSVDSPKLSTGTPVAALIRFAIVRLIDRPLAAMEMAACVTPIRSANSRCVVFVSLR